MELAPRNSSAAGSNATLVMPIPGTVGAATTAQPAPPSPPPQPPASVEAAQQAAARINEFLKSSAANVEFTVEGTPNRVIVRVVDSATHQVIRQMPTEETLAISRSLDRMTGLLLAQKA